MFYILVSSTGGQVADGQLVKLARSGPCSVARDIVLFLGKIVCPYNVS